MQQLGRGSITYGEDVDTLDFDWGRIKFLSEPAILASKRFSLGMVVLAPGKGHERHNHPGCEEIIFVMPGEGEQMVDDQPRSPSGRGRASTSPSTSTTPRSILAGSPCACWSSTRRQGPSVCCTTFQA